MPRSRSRSPRREGRRSKEGTVSERERPDRDRRRSRSRERRHRHRRSRSPRARRSRSHSPRRRSRSLSPGRERSSSSRERDNVPSKTVSITSSHVVDKPKVASSEEIDTMSKDEQDMMKLMGFSNFETTKNKKVKGNDIYVTNLQRKRRYRQYMNRRGGFNRPLDFIA